VKWTAIQAEFSVSSSSDVLAAGTERLIEELDFLFLDLAYSRDTADERKGGEVIPSRCVLLESVSLGHVWVHLRLWVCQESWGDDCRFESTLLSI